jgi:hypothetical protein
MAAIVLRAAKALPLTHNEVDANFTNLNNDKLEIGEFQLASNNTKLGAGALPSSTGGSNSAIGAGALGANTTGSSCTAVGAAALSSNTTGASNTASGVNSLKSNTSGASNTASGVNSLISNTSGGSNTASGVNSLFSNTSGASNTASGVNSLYGNTTGLSNTANGANSLSVNTTGNNNTANGANSLYSCTTGSKNVSMGVLALQVLTTGNDNVGIGHLALGNLTTGSGNIGIGGNNSGGTYAPVFNGTTENNRVVMGSTSVTNAYIQVPWTVVSDARDKTNFAPVPHGLSFVNALKPTSYQYTEDRESSTPNGPVRYGFLAQDILELEGADSVIIDSEDTDKLRYNGEALVPVLVNAVQELSVMVEVLRAQVAALS